MTRASGAYIPALGSRALTPFYDLFQRWIVGDDRYRRPLITQADIRADQKVLDLGCGTGTVVIMVKQAQPGADVHGLDADPEILAIAARKASQRAVSVTFQQGMAFALPYPDQSMDRVLSSLMIHHLKTTDKYRMAAEVFRILKPDGELHVVDFGKPIDAYSRMLGYLLHRFEEAADNLAGRLPEIFGGTGLAVTETRNLRTFFGSLTLLRGIKR